MAYLGTVSCRTCGKKWQGNLSDGYLQLCTDCEEKENERKWNMYVQENIDGLNIEQRIQRLEKLVYGLSHTTGKLVMESWRHKPIG
jgi:hypothetical protein